MSKRRSVSKTKAAGMTELEVRVEYLEQVDFASVEQMRHVIACKTCDVCNCSCCSILCSIGDRIPGEQP